MDKILFCTDITHLNISRKEVATITVIALAAIAITALAILHSPILIPATITVATLGILSYSVYRLLLLIDSYKPASQLDSRPEPKALPDDVDPPPTRKSSIPIPPDVLQEIKPPALDKETLEQAETLRVYIEKTKAAVANSDEQEAIAGLYTSIKGILDSFIIRFKLDADAIKVVVAKIGLLPLLDILSSKLAGHKLKGEIDNLKLAFEKTEKRVPASVSGSIVKTLTDRITNLTSYDEPKACRIKASKYEALFKSLLKLKTADHAKHIFKEALNPVASQLIKDIIVNLEQVNPKLSSLEYLNDIRNAWESTVPKLRDLASLALETKSDLNPAIRQVIFDVCHELYFKTDLHEENKRLLQAVLNDKNAANATLKEIFSAYEKAPSSLTTHTIDRALKSLNDVFGHYFCPLNSGNPPQKMFEMGDISVVGMGCPTYQLGYEIGKGQPAATVDPIFIASLHNLTESHLYVSNQDHTSNEKTRNQPVMSIEHNKFFAITLNKNSRLYEGEGPDSAVDYKTLIVKQFNLPIEESGCHIPKTIWPSSIVRNVKLREIANIIHSKVFNNAEKLTREDRRLFISLFNALIVLKIMKELNIKSINFTCKDGIDRGMDSLAFFVSLFFYAINKHEDPNTNENLAEILFTRAYWTRKREIKGERFHRYQDDFNHLKKLLESHKEKLTEMLAALGWKVNEANAEERAQRQFFNLAILPLLQGN